MPRIGQRLKVLRNRRRLSVRLLAERSGVAGSTISLIENDRVSPSIDTLGAILEAMGSTLSGFLAADDPVVRDPFYRRADLPEIGLENGISYKLIGLNYPNRHMQILKETYAPGADSGEMFSHAAEEGGCVIAGRVEVTVGDRVAVLGPGDAYYFDSRIEHRFRNVGDGPAEIVSAITPPSY